MDKTDKLAPLLPRLDLLDPRFEFATSELFAEVRDTSSLARTEKGYAVLDFEACMRLSRDRRLVTDHVGLVGSLVVPDERVNSFKNRTLVSLHGEAHTRMRAPLAKALGRTRSEEMRPLVRKVLSEIIDELSTVNIPDLYEGLCRRLPASLYCHWTNAPLVDHQLVARMSRDVLSIFSERQESVPRMVASYRQMFDYVEAQVDHRLGTSPDADLLGLLVSDCRAGAMTRDEIVDEVCVLLEASVENTAHQIGLVLKCLLERPGLWEQLNRDPGLVPRAVVEAMRLEPRTQSIDRRTTSEIEIHGHRVPRDSSIALWVASANRDEAAFPNPDEFVFGRPYQPSPLNFGGGVSYCLGNYTATVEIEEVVLALVTRFPGMRVAGRILVERTPFLYDVCTIPVSLGSS